MDSLEIRVTADAAQILGRGHGQVLREDFEHNCLRCPSCDREVCLEDARALVQLAQQKLELLQQTLVEAGDG